MKWTNTFVVGLYKCEMTYRKDSGMSMKWSPRMPAAKSFSPQEMEQYRSGRDNLLAEVGKHMGGSVLVIET